MKKEDHDHGDEILTTEQQAVKQITLHGDFTIVGVKEQLPELTRILAQVKALEPEEPSHRLLYDFDLSGVQALDTTGMQLLAVFFRILRQQNVAEHFLRISDGHREKIHFLGFADDIFAGERL